jgi:hypothetical protein
MDQSYIEFIVQNYGASENDVLEAFNEWVNVGYSEKEASALTERSFEFLTQCKSMGIEVFQFKEVISLLKATNYLERGQRAKAGTFYDDAPMYSNSNN